MRWRAVPRRQSRLLAKRRQCAGILRVSEESDRGGLIRFLRNTSHDVLYLDTFFNTRCTILPLFLRRLGLVGPKPVVLAPRGELDSGALALKLVKKRAFLPIAKCLGLYSGITWQASSELEARRVADVMSVPLGRVLVAPILPGALGPSSDCDWRRPGDPLVTVFLSRISRKKNLDFALQALSEVRSPVSFLIYGVGEDEAHWSECQG